MPSPRQVKGSTAPWHRRTPRHQNTALRRRAFRPEIQGLRAFAVLLVAAYHVWFGRVSGGVDVFLLISAFLMTTSFVDRIQRGAALGWREVTRYWVHVFKRIVPLAVVTVVLTLLGSRLFLGADRWVPAIREAFAVLFYGENWYSIGHAVDYYASDSGAASPFRHFWSLSIQGQIFLVWPLLFCLTSLMVRRLQARARRILALMFLAIFLGSLAYSVHQTAVDQSGAYFNTWARLWEFALGSLLAIVCTRITVRGSLAAVLSWTGLVAILLCGALLDVQGKFPGFVALWPTVAACLVIACTPSGTRWGAERILTWKPLVILGSASYALYLVHWPLLVFYLAVTGQEKAGFFAGTGLLTMATVIAWVLTRVVERPLRRWSWADARRRRGLLVIAASMLLAVGPACVWDARIASEARVAQTESVNNNPGARALLPGFRYEGSDDAAILPTPAKRADDWSWQVVRGTPCRDVDPPEALKGLEVDQCLNYHRADRPSRHVVAVGNSHMEMLLPAIADAARRNGWDLTFVRAPGCQFTSVALNDRISAQCAQWMRHTEEYIGAQKPDVLLMLATHSTVGGVGEIVRPETRQQVERWTRRGIDVVGVRDVPRFAEKHADCEARNGVAGCAFPSPLGQTNPTAEWAQQIRGFAPLDLLDLVCPDRSCPAQIGNVYTYLDNNHLTATYVDSMKHMVGDRLDTAMRNASSR